MHMLYRHFHFPMWMQYLLVIEASRTKQELDFLHLSLRLSFNKSELRRKKDGGTDNIWRKSQNEVEFHV